MDFLTITPRWEAQRIIMDALDTAGADADSADSVGSADSAGPAGSGGSALGVSHGRRKAGKVDKALASHALGRVLAEDFVSHVDVPSFRKSTVDGYAVRASETFGCSAGAPAYFDIAFDIPVGTAPRQPIGPGQAAQIATGAMLPEGADAVVMIENTESFGGSMVAVDRPAGPGENVVQAGDDLRADSVVLRAGTELRPEHIGVIASVCDPETTTVAVHARPRVGVISSGDEIVAGSSQPGPGQIRDVNSYSIAASVVRCGGEPMRFGVVRDEYQAVTAALRSAMDSCDIVLMSGGSSVGTRDYTVNAIAALGSPGILVHGVGIKPGRPTVIGMAEGKLVIGLPGHPVSALVAFELFARLAIERLCGHALALTRRRTVRAVLSENVASEPGREDYVFVRLEPAARDRHRAGYSGSVAGGLTAVPIRGRSAMISMLAMADGWVMVPADARGIAAGSEVEVSILW